MIIKSNDWDPDYAFVQQLFWLVHCPQNIIDVPQNTQLLKIYLQSHLIPILKISSWLLYLVTRSTVHFSSNAPHEYKVLFLPAIF